MDFPNATHFENGCEKFGMIWGCKPDCPVFERGECELQEENEKMFKKENSMDKNQIIETAFETIKESTEWGIEEEGKVYGYWIEGVVAVVDNLLDNFKEEKNRKSVAEW